MTVFANVLGVLALIGLTIASARYAWLELHHKTFPCDDHFPLTHVRVIREDET